MSVYFMRLGEGGPIKIGYVVDIINLYMRRSDLQTAVVDPIKILGIMEGGKTIEAELHRKFSHLRIRGELFRPEQDLMLHIETLLPPPPPPTPKQAGRKRINYEQIPARLPAGTLDRIDAVLEDGEKRADLLREAVEREIKRRERNASIRP